MTKEDTEQVKILKVYTRWLIDNYFIECRLYEDDGKGNNKLFVDILDEYFKSDSYKQFKEGVN